MSICPTCQSKYQGDVKFCPNDGTPLASSDSPEMGHVLDGLYDIEVVLGAGRTGKLYRARHLLLDQQVALKVLDQSLTGDPVRMHRFRQATRGWQRVRHPALLTVFDLRTADDGSTYLVMEYCAGRTLAGVLQEGRQFTFDESLEVLEPLAHALDAAREGGIYYPYFSPSDVMLQEAESEDSRVKLFPPSLDFSLELANAPYLAGELWGGRMPADDLSRPDIYSLGVIAYEMWSGQKLYEGTNLTDIALKFGEFTPLQKLVPELPAHAARAVEQVIAKSLDQDPISGEQFISALRGRLTLNTARRSVPETRTTGRIAACGDTSAQVPFQVPVPGTRTYLGRAYKTKREPPTRVRIPVKGKPLYTDENVQFTVYRPESVAPVKWHKLLAFAHLSKRRPDAPPDEPDPLAEVQRIAARVLADEPAKYEQLKHDSQHAVPHESEITFVPVVDGFEFNPPSQSFFWQRTVHKVEFDMRGAAALDGQTARGRLTVFLGSLILADVPLAIRVDSAEIIAPPVVPSSASPYRKIFASYSHHDREIVEQIEHHIQALGDKYVRDVTELRSGQDWQRWMNEAINDADVFQLFWSHNAMRSTYVRQEWEHALSLQRRDFIRPIYWETPLPENPAEKLPPEELRRLHFQHLRPALNTHPAQPAATTAAATEDAVDDIDTKIFWEIRERQRSSASPARTSAEMSEMMQPNYDASPKTLAPPPSEMFHAARSTVEAPPVPRRSTRLPVFLFLLLLALLAGLAFLVYRILT